MCGLYECSQPGAEGFLGLWKGQGGPRTWEGWGKAWGWLAFQGELYGPPSFFTPSVNESL